MTPGSVAVVSNETIYESSEIMRASQLSGFEGQVAVQTWCKELDVASLAPQAGKESYR